MKKGQIPKTIVRAVSVIMGLYGLLSVAMVALVLLNADDVGMSELFLFAPQLGISSILIGNAVLVFRSWSAKSIGVFSAIVSVLLASGIVSAFSVPLDDALKGGETLRVSAIVFAGMILFMALFLALKAGLTKHTLMDR